MTTNPDIKLNSILNKPVKLESVCRICLSENIDNPKGLYEMHASMSFAEMVMLCARVDIRAEDRLPDVICEPCLRDAEAAYGFRLRCERSDSLLRGAVVQPLPMEGCPDPLVKCEEDADSDIQNETSEPVMSDNEWEATKLWGLAGRQRKEDLANASPKKDKEKVICDICEKPLASSLSLKQHQARMHGEARRLRVGAVTGHGAGKRYHCPECAYCSPRRHNLLYHLRVHSGERPHACADCGAAFSQPGALADHRKVHSPATFFGCPRCSKRFKRKNQLVRHRRVHSGGTFPCTICDKRLKSNDSLQQHIRRHLDIRNYSCDSCGRTFVTSADLSSHKRSHGDGGGFECDSCGRRTRFKRSMEAHIRRHSGQRAFKCALCDYSAFCRGALNRHSTKHSRQKNYSCPVCLVKFLHSSSVNDHMLKQHGIKYRVCDHIDRRVIK